MSYLLLFAIILSLGNSNPNSLFEHSLRLKLLRVLPNSTREPLGMPVRRRAPSALSEPA